MAKIFWTTSIDDSWPRCGLSPASSRENEPPLPSGLFFGYSSLLWPEFTVTDIPSALSSTW